MSDEILIKPNKDGVWDKYEPYAIIHVETEEDFNHMNELMRVGEKMQWIPCSKRLPTNYDNLLICQSDGYVNVGYYSLNEFKDVNSYPYKDVVAWMPLPEPYKGE